MNDIQQNLRIVSAALPEEIFRRLDRAGYIIENSAKDKCRVRSGILRASTSHYVTDGESHEIQEYDSASKTLHQAEASKSGSYSVIIGTNVDYGEIEHERNPYLQQAFDENLSRVKNEFIGLLEDCDHDN